MAERDNVGSTPTSAKGDKMKDKKEIYVFIPDLEPYEGIKVNKETVIKFKNDKVKQTIKDLKLVSIYTFKCDKYISTNKLEMNLEEGEILLFEGENRGWFLPKDIGVCSIDEAIEQYGILKDKLKKEDL